VNEEQAREQFALHPEAFWRWVWEAFDLPLEHRYLLRSLGRGYRRSFVVEPDLDARTTLFGRIALWWLWTHPDSAVLWPELDRAHEAEMTRVLSAAMLTSKQYAFRSAFSMGPGPVVFVRQGRAEVARGVGITADELAQMTAEDFSTRDVLLMFPDFDATPTPLVLELCGKMVSPRALIAGGTTLPHAQAKQT